MVAMLAIILIVLISEIYMRIYFGTKDRLEIASSISRELADSVYAGIKHPMELGDSEAIRKELSDIREKMKDVEVFICDFNQEIAYSTHRNRVKKKVTEYIQNRDVWGVLTEILKTGAEPKIDSRKPFEDKVAGRRYLVVMRPVLNEPDCYHCHGSSKKVLGGVVIRLDAERTYAQVEAQRNRTILIVLFLIPIAILLIYIMVNRLVRKPVESLAEKAKQFAEGDMSVSVDIKTEDEIGILARTFNYMVESVSSFSRKLEQEITRKTALLNERTRLLELLERANRELRELDKLKSTFLANMSHELRTPMNSIIGYTDLLIDGVDGPINEEQEKSLKKVASNAKHLLQLINDVLDISKIESGKIELHPKEIDLARLLESITPAFEPLIQQKGLSMKINISEGLPLIYADEARVKQILINLLANAIKFTQHGGITLTASPSERGIQQGGEPILAEICVTDTGIGIKEEDISKIFDKFVQADLTTVRQYEGTGLGLSIARGLVSLHKGMIWVNSKPGEGSSFCFTLPLKKELLEQPSEPLVETKMAEALSEYFGKPVDTFLKQPEFAGKPIKCWEYMHCGQPTCPAYKSKESRCWLVLGTQCAGIKIACYPEKVDFCKGCELIESLVIKPEEAYRADDNEPSAGEKNNLKTVLAIDDNPEAIDIIRKYLGDEYRVVGLLSSKNVIEKAKEINPMAITLDIMMPNKDGWQVLRELKQDPGTQDIPVIILSIIDRQRLGFSLGAADYILKPVGKDILLRKLKNLEKTKSIRRILIVDNDMDTIRDIGNVLKEGGYIITSAYNGEDAIQSIKDSHPDLIVMNLTMPEISGFDVIEHLKTAEGSTDIPLILLTNKDLTEKETDDLNGRIQGILNKVTLTKEDLVKAIKETIGKVQ